MILKTELPTNLLLPLTTIQRQTQNILPTRIYRQLKYTANDNKLPTTVSVSDEKFSLAEKIESAPAHFEDKMYQYILSQNQHPPTPATTATTSLRWLAGDNSHYHARKAPAVAEPRLRPVHVLVCDSRHPASSDAGIFCPARLWRGPCHKTCAPAPAPDSAARRRPPSNPTTRWAARSRAALASARLCPASSGVDHRPCSRPPWLRTTVIARGGGEGGAIPGGGGGGKDGGLAGVGRCCDVPPPCILIAVWRFLRRGRGSFIGKDRRQTNANQKLTKGVF
jgi:hypothetical protein